MILDQATDTDNGTKLEIKKQHDTNEYEYIIIPARSLYDFGKMESIITLDTT